MSRRRPLGLRVRLAALVGLASFAVLAVAGVAVVWEVDRRMHETVRGQAIEGLEQARVGLVAGASPAEVTAVQPGEPVIALGPDAVISNEEASVHIRISPSLLEELADVEPGETTVVRDQAGDNPVFLAVTSDLAPDGVRYIIASAAPLAETEGTLAAIRTATIVAVPTLAVLLGALAAVIAGRALRPVAKMRAEADAISHGTLHHRLTPAARSAELADLAETMNDMLDRLEKAATSQRQFVSDVSHEFRSPLATIRGTVELALAEANSMADAGPVALDEIDRLDTLVGDLLALSRLDEAEHAATEDLDLEDLVASHVAAIRRPQLVIDTSRVEHARINADRRAIVGLVRNLLDNAARHAASTVTITLTAEGDQVGLIVDDDGPGIPADQRQRVFDRFTRLDDARSRDGGGTGLGLAVAAAATHAQGGAITVSDAPAGGARFEVTLPARPPDRVAPGPG